MNTHGRWVVLVGVGYVVVLIAFVVGGAVAFRNLYAAPAPQPGTEFAPSYRLFLAVCGGVLALYLGLLAAALVTVSRRWWLGACGLLGGLMVTVAALSVLPWVRFPNDQYAAGAAWVFSWAPACMGLWLLMSAVGWLRRPQSA